MKTKFIILVASAIAFCSFQNAFAQNVIEKQDTTRTIDSAKIIYTCPMHSEILSDKPGNCPKCGMKLVIKTSSVNRKNDGQNKMDMKMMCMPMGDMNQAKENNHPNRMMLMLGTMMGVMMVVMLVVLLSL